MKDELIGLVKEIEEQMEIHRSLYFLTSICHTQEKELKNLIYEVYRIPKISFQLSLGKLEGYIEYPDKPGVLLEYTLDIENDILIETNRETNITKTHKLTVHTTPSDKISK